MNIGRYDRVKELLKRVKRKSPAHAKTLESRMEVFRKTVGEAKWKSPIDVKKQFGSADNVGSNRIVFDVCGNSYRIVAAINYAAGYLEIRFAGTHEEYNRIDAKSV